MHSRAILLLPIFTLFTVARSNGSCPSSCQCVKSEEPVEILWTCSDVTSSSDFRDSDFRNVTTLILVNSKLANGSFAGLVFASVKHLIFKRTFYLSEDAMQSFPQLETLDVSSTQIYCDQSLTWLQKWKHLFVNLEETSCLNIAPHNGTNLLRALKFIDYLNATCPKECSCKIDFLSKTEDLLPSVTVNCSERGLDDFPRFLPHNISVKLDLRNNKIKNLTALSKNPAYLRVPTVYLDNNQIKSLSELEGSEWIEHFSLLSLVGNRISSLPTEALENAFKKNKNGVEMHLGRNPWKCDCEEILNFQTFVAKFTKLVKDIAEVRCADSDSGQSGRNIMFVDPVSVCHTPEKSIINSMDVVNTCLAVLIILTIGKLLYDYYDFRKTGRLPWIISMLP